MANRYTYAPPFTADELHYDYVVSVMSQVEIGKKWGVSQKVVWRALIKAGIASRKAAARNQRLVRNPNWKGGRRLDPIIPVRSAYSDRGYVSIYKPDHPHARQNGYVAEHIVVATEAEQIDRLPDGFCVHHINLKKDDNSSENLAICDHKTHQFYHTQLEELAVRLLLETGRIKFKKGAGYVEA